ncbi:glucan 1,3-beta-glucosidase-like [Lotus japonicus]|uniref:glucan 1,3-beta-glucosidase-like n=1 Tax=Lotus japonicus TaxID=34305 RepID=UPI0025879120|nr:glucan 1,3-beta-glucosidase-like [Lotus japonicus]
MLCFYNVYQAISETLVTADYEGSSWEDNDPSVFKMIILNHTILKGEYQLTNGYGQDRAPTIMQDHWNTYITEDDFRFISTNGLNAVRIPVGWWIAQDPTPPKPFVGGSLEILDNAFTWAQKYGLKVIVDLHAVPGSQNGTKRMMRQEHRRNKKDDDMFMFFFFTEQESMFTRVKRQKRGKQGRKNMTRGDEQKG